MMLFKSLALLGGAALVAGVEDTSAQGRGVCTARDGCRDIEDATLLQTMRQEVSPHRSLSDVQLGGLATCTGPKIGKCICVVELGFTTYSFADSAGDQRCFTVYVPPKAKKPMPVLWLIECNFGQDPEDMAPRMANKFGPRGVATVFVGSHNTGWTNKLKMRNNIGKDNPQVCNSVDVEFGRTILAKLESDEETFEKDAIYVSGFSQNGFLAHMIGFCFSSRIRGIMAGGSPIIVPTETRVYDPDEGLGLVLGDYARLDLCSECLSWPIYPCHEPSHPMKVCLAAMNNDPYVWDVPPTHSMNDESYQLLKSEGHIVTNIVWHDSQGHAKQNLWNDWILSCLQILPPCPATCWDSYKMKLLCYDCAMTKEMLLEAVPTATMEGTPGSFASPDAAPPNERPEGSVCEHAPVSLELPP